MRRPFTQQCVNARRERFHAFWPTGLGDGKEKSMLIDIVICLIRIVFFVMTGVNKDSVP